MGTERSANASNTLVFGKAKAVATQLFALVDTGHTMMQAGKQHLPLLGIPDGSCCFLIIFTSMFLSITTPDVLLLLIPSHSYLQAVSTLTYSFVDMDPLRTLNKPRWCMQNIVQCLKICHVVYMQDDVITIFQRRSLADVYSSIVLAMLSTSMSALLLSFEIPRNQNSEFQTVKLLRRFEFLKISICVSATYKMLCTLQYYLRRANHIEKDILFFVRGISSIKIQYK